MVDVLVVGGGLVGMAAAYELAQQGKKVVLIEKSPQLGGLARGFRGRDWEWPLEYAYHHLFKSDTDILNFLKKIGFDQVFFRKPTTSSLYTADDGSFQTYPLDTPLDLLRFSRLTPLERVRMGITLALLKISPFFQWYETQTLEEFMSLMTGHRAYEVMFGGVMRKKYGKYAGNILASFIWARINKRSKALGYIAGGFQSFIDYLEKSLVESGVTIIKGGEIIQMERWSRGYRTQVQITTGVETQDTVSLQVYDSTYVVCSAPSPVTAQIAREILSPEEIGKLKNLKYLWATTLILETDKPILDHTYWLSLCTPQIPGLVMIQHTNYIDKSHYNGHHILYIGNYIDTDDPLLRMTKEETTALYLPDLRKLSRETFTIIDSFRFVAPHAQPIFDKEFLKNKPQMVTSAPGFYLANLDMTYPYDRGTNYAVKLGVEVAAKIGNAVSTRSSSLRIR